MLGINLRSTDYTPRKSDCMGNKFAALTPANLDIVVACRLSRHVPIALKAIPTSKILRSSGGI